MTRQEENILRAVVEESTTSGGLTDSSARSAVLNGERSAAEICCECGESVACGSGRFVNRVPDLNGADYRAEMGRPYPQGDFVCAECGERIYRDMQLSTM